jgi:hypothetical protein
LRTSAHLRSRNQRPDGERTTAGLAPAAHSLADVCAAVAFKLLRRRHFPLRGDAGTKGGTAHLPFVLHRNVCDVGSTFRG